MAEYTNLFNSSFPNSIMETSNFKDINDIAKTDADKAATLYKAASDYMTYFKAGDISAAQAVIEANADLKQCLIGANDWNRLSEEIRNLEIYIATILPETDILMVSEDQVAMTDGVIWIEEGTI